MLDAGYSILDIEDPISNMELSSKKYLSEQLHSIPEKSLSPNHFAWQGIKDFLIPNP
jgi:hypothetical protein